VGDAPTYYTAAPISHLCVEPGDPEATAAALLDVASSYGRYRSEFAANGAVLRERHSAAGEALMRLLHDVLLESKSAEPATRLN
jgi:hypothetical protein